MANRPDVQKLVISAISGVALLGAHVATADSYIHMDFSTNKTCFQTAPFVQTFQKGDFTIRFQDGLVIIDGGCPLNDSAIDFPPSDIPPCPLGGTAFVAQGDLDHDGVRDDLSYWSVSSVIDNALVEAFRPELVSLNAAPNSPLPRPQNNFNDEGIATFYNLFGNTYEYDEATYSFSRTYALGTGELVRMNRELPLGQYQFLFPIKGQPNRPYPITVALTPFVEPFLANTAGRNQFRIIGGHWNAGAYEVDPRVLNRISWQGNTSSNIRPSLDALYFSIFDSTDSAALFPPSGRTRILSPLGTSTTIPPFFFLVGDDGIIHVDFERSQGGILTDISTRHFEAPIRFIDTYAGFAQITFPVGSKSSTITSGADYDKDGWSNLTEYAYQSDATNTDAAVPDSPLLTGNFTVTPPATNAVRTVTILKRPNTGLSLTYGFQTSTDGVHYKAAKLTTAGGWTVITDDTTTLQVQSTAAIPASVVFRPTVKANY